VVAPSDPNRLFAIGTGYISSAYRIQTSLSTDGGANWLRDTFAYSSHGYAAALDRERLLIGGDSAGLPLLGVSTNLGATWASLRSGLSGAVYSIALTSDSNLLYCGTTQGVFKTTNGGLSWSRRGAMSQVRAVCADEVNARVVYAGTASGVYASSDAGETWQPFNAGLGNTDVLSLALRSGPGGKLFCGTNGASVSMIDGLTGAEEEPCATCPSSFAVRPNPVRAGSATLQVRGLTERWSGRPVSVSVHDAAGRVVLSRVLDLARDGSCAGLDLRGLGAGVYLVRLSAGGALLRRQVVLTE